MSDIEDLFQEKIREIKDKGNQNGLRTFRLIRSIIVPGVPIMIWAVIFVASLGKFSLMAYSVCTFVYLPIAVTTDMI